MSPALGVHLRAMNKKQRRIALLLTFAVVVTLSHLFVLGAVIVLSHAQRAPLRKKAPTPPPASHTSRTDARLFSLAALPTSDALKNVRLIDTRPTTACESSSLPDAICLSPRDIFGPGGRLAAFPDIRWLLGTLGLDGTKPTIVFGDNARARDIIAGILYLAGQNRVGVVEAAVPPSRLSGHGTTRSMVRQIVYTAPMRDRSIVTHDQLRRLILGGGGTTYAYLIDGRSQHAYWGQHPRGQRGGHIPGADSVPVTSLSRPPSQRPLLPSRRPLIAYGDGPAQGLALLTRLLDIRRTSARARGTSRGGRIADIAVYLDGWRRWASDSTLPVDSATYGAPAHADALSSR